MGNLWSRFFLNKSLLSNKLLTGAFVQVNGIAFARSNGLIIKCLKACLMN